MRHTILIISLIAMILLVSCSQEEEKKPTLRFEDLPDTPTHGDELIEGDVDLNVGNNVGQVAPDFTVTTLSGEEVHLRSVEKPIVVEFIATWCPHCRNDLNVVKNVYPKYSDEVDFITLGMDLSEDEATLLSYQKANGYEVLPFARADRQILQDYGIRYTTTKYAIGRDGTIMWKGSGEVNSKVWETILKGLAAT